jgi:hypothetical protein
MTEFGELVPAEEPKAEEPKVSFLKNLHWLYFWPRRFFERINAPEKKAWLYIFALTFGISATIDRISLSAWRGVSAPETWAGYWTIVILGGFIGMLFAYYVSAWFYNVVLGWCGVRQENRHLVRMVLFASCQVVALPTILAALVSTIAFSDPIAADLREAQWVGWVMIMFAVWSYGTIYVGTRTVFKAPKLRAAFWFLVLPTALLVLSIVGMHWLASIGGLPAPKAAVSSPLEFSSSDMAFSYPGNWRITDKGPAENIKDQVQIQSIGTFVSLQRVETWADTGDPDDIETLADNWAESLDESFSQVAELGSFAEWGKLQGAGRTFEARTKDVTSLACEIRIFVAPIADGEVLMVLELFPQSEKADIEPGLELIRSTFRSTSGN